MIKSNRTWIYFIIGAVFISILFLTRSCKKANEPFRMDLLTSRSWSLVKVNSTDYGDDEYCVFAFRPDGTLMNYNFIDTYSTWRFKEDGWILTMDSDDYKVLELTENELIIKYNTDLGHTYTFKALLSIYYFSNGVSDLSKTSAILHATVRTNSFPAHVSFDFGTSTDYGQTINATNSSVEAFRKEAVNSSVTGLLPETVYHYRLKVVVNSETFYSYDLSFRTFNTLSVNDIDGNTYNTITIGSQTWLAENLKATKYSNGDIIPYVNYYYPEGNSPGWGSLNTGARCENTNETDFHSTYGWFYNWYAVADARNICPAGWHVPTDNDWTLLTQDLGMDILAGVKLKESGTSHWAYPNSAATNETGFSALPGACRPQGNGYIDPGWHGFWWTATEYDSYQAKSCIMANGAIYVSRGKDNKTSGFSVRCVKN
jgi:uncharacterized protein (TIGR02145 family)